MMDFFKNELRQRYQKKLAMYCSAEKIKEVLGEELKKRVEQQKVILKAATIREIIGKDLVRVVRRKHKAIKTRQVKAMMDAMKHDLSKRYYDAVSKEISPEAKTILDLVKKDLVKKVQ